MWNAKKVGEWERKKMEWGWSVREKERERREDDVNDNEATSNYVH